MTVRSWGPVSFLAGAAQRTVPLADALRRVAGEVLQVVRVAPERSEAIERAENGARSEARGQAVVCGCAGREQHVTQDSPDQLGIVTIMGEMRGMK